MAWGTDIKARRLNQEFIARIYNCLFLVSAGLFINHEQALIKHLALKKRFSNNSNYLYTGYKHALHCTII